MTGFSRFLIALITLVTTGVVSANGIVLEPALTGLSNVTDITHAGDTRLFLAEKSGQVLIAESGTVSGTPFLDISALTSTGFEQGLLGIAFHPDYVSNGYFYVNYTNTASKSVLARYSRSAGDANLADPKSGEILILVDHPNASGHYGGQVAFDANGYLFTSFGDGGVQGDPECDSQDTTSLLGTVVRLDVDSNQALPPYYAVPKDNPFVSGGHLPEVWAFGLRNPWRFDIDPVTSRLFLSDVGQSSREEINITNLADGGGENYGWKVMEGVACYDPDPIDTDCPVATASCFDASYTNPFYDYDHSQGDCSITGGVVYRGDAIPALNGHYLFGDWCTGRLWSAQFDLNPEPQLLDVSLSGVQAFGRDQDGEVYVTDGGTVYRITQLDEIFGDSFGDI